MNSFRRFAVASVLYCGLAGAAAAQPLPIDMLILMPGEKEQVDAFKERLRQIPYLANSKEDVSGSNIILIASVAQVPTSGGNAVGMTTGLLAASTLGLIPTVENKDISVHYELRANYVTIASFDYSKNFTSVSNLWGKFGKLPDDARQWVMSTVDALAQDLQSHPPAAALQAEYDLYSVRK